MTERAFQKCADRNMKALEFERFGEVDKAIKLYERNVSDRFEGSGPYVQLVSIYSTRKEYDQAIRVLNVAIDVFENDCYPLRADVAPKLEKFRKKLADMEKKASKEKTP